MGGSRTCDCIARVLGFWYGERMENHTDNITTIEALAALIQRTVAKKEDLEALRTEMATKDDIAVLAGKIDGIEVRLDHLDARVGRIEADIHELSADRVRRHEFEDALDRITHVERKLGIDSGV
jgi:seryl-tRNA synthetase